MDLSSSSTTTSTTRTVPNNFAASTSSNSSNRREIRLRNIKRMKTQNISSSSSLTSTKDSNDSSKTSWKSSTTQKLYSSKLLAALRHVRATPATPSAPRRSRAVREAADKALAVAAKGRTRWSRAILSNKIKLKYFNKIHRRQKVNVTGPNRLPAPQASMILRLKGKKNSEKELGGVERKVKTLGRLVPGCRKETLPVILEEATDYIPALEMQIRAMRDLLEKLSAAGVGSSSSSGDGGGGASSEPPLPSDS